MTIQFLYSHYHTNGTKSGFVKFTIHIRTHRKNVNIKLDNFIYTFKEARWSTNNRSDLQIFFFLIHRIIRLKTPNTKAHIFECFSSQSKFIQSSLSILTYYNWTQHRMKLHGFKKKSIVFHLIKKMFIASSFKASNSVNSISSFISITYQLLYTQFLLGAVIIFSDI